MVNKSIISKINKYRVRRCNYKKLLSNAYDDMFVKLESSKNFIEMDNHMKYFYDIVVRYRGEKLLNSFNNYEFLKVFSEYVDYSIGRMKDDSIHMWELYSERRKNCNILYVLMYRF